MSPLRLLFFTQLAGAAASLALWLLIVTGAVELWHIYLQLAAQEAVRAFDVAARQTLFPQLVPRSRLTQAVTLTVTAGRSSRFVGPVLGGLAIAQLGVAAPFLLNAATFALLMAALGAMRGVATHRRAEHPSIRRDLLDGLRHIAASPVLRGMLTLEVVFSLLQMNEVMITILALQVFRVGPEAAGLLLSAPALGSLAGISGMLVAMPARQGRFVVLVTYAYAASLVFVAISPGYAVAFVALLAVGIFDSLETVTRHSVMQMAAPAEMRGRVMANMNTVTQGLGPVSQAQSGLLAALMGSPLAISITAVGLAVAALLTARNNPALWRFVSERTEPDANG